MTKPDDVPEPHRWALGVNDDRCLGESSWSDSGSILAEWDHPTDWNGSTDEGHAEKQNWNAGPIYLICLTIGTGGLQVIWTAIMGHGSVGFLVLFFNIDCLHNGLMRSTIQSYLSSLGLPPFVISFIWLAGPLSGAIVQPYVSVLSDHSRHPWGQRKPFILVGTIFTIVFMLLLPWTGEIVSCLFNGFGNNAQSTAAFVVRGLVAASLIWGLNIAIQPVQMGTRALICEACPSHQKLQATAYSSCITGIGSVFGYASGFVNLPLLLPWLGDTQFKCVCVVASLSLGVTIAVTLYVVQERELIVADEDMKTGLGVFNVFRQVYTCVVGMPEDMKMVCKVQFFAWVGWFPFLFYVTTYLAGLYERNFTPRFSDNKTNKPPIRFQGDAIRYGTFAMALFAIVALISNILLLLVVSWSKSNIPTHAVRLATLPTAFSKTLNSKEERRLPQTNSRDQKTTSVSMLRSLRINPRLASRWLTLPRAWTASHILTSTVLFSTFLTRSTIVSTFLVSLLGISWALTLWAPLALINVFIANQQSYHTIPSRNEFHCRSRGLSDRSLEVPTRNSSDYTSDEERLQGEEQSLNAPHALQTGTIMGVFNMAIAAPQIAAALGCSAIFWMFRWYEFDDAEAVGWVIRIGGLAGLVAAWFASGIHIDNDDGRDKSSIPQTHELMSLCGIRR